MKILNARHRRRFWQKLKQLLAKNYEARKYQKWIRRFDTLTDKDRENIFTEIENFKHKPLVSIVLPVYNVEEKWLRLCIESVLKQIYENWEFCIADDFSPSPRIRRVLEEYAKKDGRIKVVFRMENGHISAASNSALELASGEFTAFLDHDDELAEHALFYVVKEINDFPETEMIYSDEDMIDEKGNRYTPKFKPDWSRDLFYSLNLVTHLSVYKTSILRKIGGFRIGLEGSQDYDLALRFTERISENQIHHIPHILYHWRAIRGSVAFSSDEKPYAHERAREALRAHFERTGKAVTVSRSIYNLHRVQYQLPAAPPPKVSLIITADEDFQTACEAIKNFGINTDYPNLEIIIVASSEKLASEFKAAHSKAGMSPTANTTPTLKFVVCEKKSEAEKYNFAVAETSGEIVCFADANLKPAAKDWLTEMASFACQTEIGAVGAKLLYADETILHGGLIFGADGLVGVAHHCFPRSDDGNFTRAQLVNNFSAVSISCLAVRREVFESVGGFDAENFQNKLYDADFCLRLRREKNYRVVFTPYAELIKTDAKKRLNLEKDSTAVEKYNFMQKWRETVERDPFYNPNLSKKDASFSIAI
ncbi:MAG: Glycosyl transferase, group 2 family [uncultured Pyrinomonadaceae bacterium]|uniref:Glycosyl transferase, group 2 family n=1 Tax=uncultured Pyrinomonadaceae bacterium TaxID=2283094 RepID=A0A6J4P9U5_9BACT|nr:MAG: Glycosyl transferase, group 2 family [uncultured Pyrinomonadaceae bacterium]